MKPSSAAPGQACSVLLTDLAHASLHSLLAPRCRALALAVVDVEAEEAGLAQQCVHTGVVAALVKDYHRRGYFMQVYSMVEWRQVCEYELQRGPNYQTPAPRLHHLHAKAHVLRLRFGSEVDADNFAEAARQLCEATAQGRRKQAVPSQPVLPQPVPPQPVTSQPVTSQPVHVGRDVGFKGIAMKWKSKGRATDEVKWRSAREEENRGMPRSKSVPFLLSASPEDKRKSHGKKITKDMIGRPQDFQHLSHIGANSELTPIRKAPTKPKPPPPPPSAQTSHAPPPVPPPPANSSTPHVISTLSSEFLGETSSAKSMEHLNDIIVCDQEKTTPDSSALSRSRSNDDMLIHLDEDIPIETETGVPNHIHNSTGTDSSSEIDVGEEHPPISGKSDDDLSCSDVMAIIDEAFDFDNTCYEEWDEDSAIEKVPSINHASDLLLDLASSEEPPASLETKTIPHDFTTLDNDSSSTLQSTSANYTPPQYNSTSEGTFTENDLLRAPTPPPPRRSSVKRVPSIRPQAQPPPPPSNN